MRMSIAGTSSRCTAQSVVQVFTAWHNLCSSYQRAPLDTKAYHKAIDGCRHCKKCYIDAVIGLNRFLKSLPVEPEP